MKYCMQCGQPLAENALFCAYCGAKVVLPEQPARPEPVPEDIAKPVEEAVAEEPKPVEEAAPAEEPKTAEEPGPVEEPASEPKAAQPETDFAPEQEPAPQPASAPQPQIQPQTHQSAVYSAPAEYKAAPAAAGAKKKGNLALPIVAIALAFVASFLFGIFVGLIDLSLKGIVSVDTDTCVLLARVFVSLLATGALVFGIIGLIKNIKAKKVVGIILSAVGLSYALSLFSLLGDIETIVEIVSRFIGLVSFS